MGAWVLLRDDRQADTPSPPQLAPAAAPALTTPPVAPVQALSAPAAPSGQAGALTVTNRFGRSGAYFLPAGFDDAPRPLLVALHGSGWNGAGFLLVLRPFAEEQGLLVIAPDSGLAPNGIATWQVGDKPGDRTDDFHHVQRALEELNALPGVRVDTARVLALGYSGGGSSASYLATNDPRFTAFAVLHGGVFAGGLGEHAIRGWFSTGQGDPARPPALVKAAAEQAGARGLAVEFHTYPGGHELSREELREVIQWWLGH